MLEEIVDTLFKGTDYYFQQDSVAAHKAKKVQQWLMEKVPSFIVTNEWLHGSPNLNPLDYLL